MNIDTSLSGMVSAQMQINQSAQNIAQVANITGDTQFQEDAVDIVDSLVQMTPQTIAYQANAQGIITQNQVFDTVLDIKA